MKIILVVCVIYLCTNCVNGSDEQKNKRYENDANVAAEEALMEMENNVTIYATAVMQESWNFFTNAIDSNSYRMTSSKNEFGQVYHSWWENFLLDYDYSNVTDVQLIRQFQMQSVIGTAILDGDNLSKLNDIISQMSQSHSSKVCMFEESCDGEHDELYTISDVKNLLRTSRDFMQKAYYWAAWREKTGTEMVQLYWDYVEIMNFAAQSNGFSHAGEMWLYPYLGDNYSSDDFWEEADFLFWNKTFPLYKKLHSYVTWQLESSEEFANRIDKEDKLIPVNILGSISGENWQGLYDVMIPYPSEHLINITDSLLQLNSPQSMFQIAEDFYVEIGMNKLPLDYWKSSVFEDSESIKTLCVPKTWDFYNTAEQEDTFRVSACAKLTEEDLINIHEDMSLTQYALAYKEQPLVFRKPANPAIAAGIAGAMGLSVSTPQHLNKIRATLNPSNKFEDIEYNKYFSVNYLFRQALKVIPDISYFYLMEKWRWEVFNGNIAPSQYNYEWWKMRMQAQGLKPPFPRTPQDFDIAANENIGMNTPAFGNFLGKILQFQIYERLCDLADQKENKYFCDIYGSYISGSILTNDILENGASLPWEDQLDRFIGTKQISAEPMIKYFEPLFEYIDLILDLHVIEDSWNTDADLVNDYVIEPKEISAAVPITVGCLFALMVLIVLIAFCIGKVKKAKKNKIKNHFTKDGDVQMEEVNVELPRREGTITHLDNDSLTKRRKAVEEEIKNSLGRSDVESAINVSFTDSSQESEEKTSSGCCSEASVKIKNGQDNECFENSESSRSRL